MLTAFLKHASSPCIPIYPHFSGDLLLPSFSSSMRTVRLSKDVPRVGEVGLRWSREVTRKMSLSREDGEDRVEGVEGERERVLRASREVTRVSSNPSSTSIPCISNVCCWSIIPLNDPHTAHYSEDLEKM